MPEVVAFCARGVRLRGPIWLHLDLSPLGITSGTLYILMGDSLLFALLDSFTK